MRVAAITKLFPNAAEPLSAPFNRQQFAALARLCEVTTLATIPWHPLRGRATKNIPWRETIAGLQVLHPRTLYVPRALHGTWGGLYAASLMPWWRELLAADVWLAAWAYPDGVGALRLAALLAKPVVVKVHGSDINHVATLPGPRRELQAWLPRAAAVVCVNQAMTAQLQELGVSAAKICVVENGIDAQAFHVRDAAGALAAGQALRAAAGVSGAGLLILYVGNLKREKGILDLCEAARSPALAASEVVILGDGTERHAVAQLAAASRAPGWRGARIHVLGARVAGEIAAWMRVAHVLCLPSWMEGTPNVIREALACGLRVVASDVGGIPALLSPDNGQLVPPRHPGALTAALGRELAAAYDRRAVAATSKTKSWDDSARALHEVLRRAAGAQGPLP